MGSVRLRLAALCVVAAVAGAVAAPVRADGDAAIRTASSLIDALGRQDAAVVCALFTPQAIDRLGGLERCVKAFAPSPSQLDDEATATLARAYRAAVKSAAKRKGRYVTKSFRAKALAREMERIDSELTVKLGRNANAAAGELVTTAVLDTRTSPRRLVLYVESDDGSIFRLTAASRGSVQLREVAQGIPEANPPAPEPPSFTFAVDGVRLFGDTAFVRVTLTQTEDDETYTYGIVVELIASPGAPNGYLVADILFSALSVDEP